MSTSLIGALFAGRFRVERLLGTGGMGSVYLARHEVLQRKFAIKILHANLITDLQIAATFRREARAASRVDHPHVTAVFDYGHTEDGRPYLVMEYVKGATLTKVLDRQGPLPLPIALHILEQTADALAAAHARGVVHRDLKPQNILLTTHRGSRNFVKILDFGLAKLIGVGVEGVGSGRLDDERFAIGTPDYMSPEHCRNGDIDHRSDIYSFGVLSFELLVGRVPFSGSLWQRLGAHAHQTPLSPSAASERVDIPPRVDALVARCLQKKPEDRFAQAAEISHEIRSIRHEMGDVPARRRAAHDEDTPVRSYAELGTAPTMRVDPALVDGAWAEDSNDWGVPGHEDTGEWFRGYEITRTFAQDVEELACILRDRGIGSPELSRRLARKIRSEDDIYRVESRVALLNAEIVELELATRHREMRLRQALSRLEHERQLGEDGAKVRHELPREARGQIDQEVDELCATIARIERKAETRSRDLNEKLALCREYLEERRRLLVAEERALAEEVEAYEGRVCELGDAELVELFRRTFVAGPELPLEEQLTPTAMPVPRAPLGDALAALDGALLQLDDGSLSQRISAGTFVGPAPLQAGATGPVRMPSGRARAPRRAVSHGPAPGDPEEETRLHATFEPRVAPPASGALDVDAIAALGEQTPTPVTDPLAQQEQALVPPPTAPESPLFTLDAEVTAADQGTPTVDAEDARERDRGDEN